MVTWEYHGELNRPFSSKQCQTYPQHTPGRYSAPIKSSIKIAWWDNLQVHSHLYYIYMCVCKCIIIYTYICVCECVHINIAVGFLSHRIPITSPLYHRFRTLPETSWVEPPPLQWSGPVVLQPTNKPRSVTLDKHVGFHEQPWPVISQNILGKQII
jgi:hypothetical protein